MSCVAPGCKSGYGTEKLPDGVTKHVFPKNPVLFEKWIKAIPRADWKPAKNSVICSLHFEQSDYKTEKTGAKKEQLKRRRLKPGVYPLKYVLNL